MKISHFPPPHTCGSTRKAAFSLVEVTLALGVVAFAFLSLFSLLPLSLNMARESMSRTHSARITQSLMTKVQQTPFEDVTAKFIDSISYYDSEAQWIVNQPASAPPPTTFVYAATVVDPGSHVAHNVPDRGLSVNRTKTLAIRIATNRKVSVDNDPAPEETQIAFLVADVKM